ncbi:septal ring lytic transglycosylase RlpA family protein [Amorphus sp. MBR-141]
MGSSLLLKVGVIATGCIMLAACNTTDKASIDPKYGVPASPRLIGSGQAVPKGGGRAIVGKPYKVAGKWYTPKEDPDYEAVGKASWYGSAFHGRQTANGEIFDSRSITAAHTTMPLPSYARVTNVKNGKSIVVRVNDRGPFHGSRVIDVSQRTAEILGFRQDGIGQVKVAYVGPARLDGHDEDFLLASYQGPGEPGTTPRKEAPERSIQLASKDARQSKDRATRVAPRREVLPPQSATGALLAYNDSKPRKAKAVPIHAGPPPIESTRRGTVPAARAPQAPDALPGVAASAPEPVQTAAPAPSAAPVATTPAAAAPEPAPKRDPMAELLELAADESTNAPADVAAAQSYSQPMVMASVAQPSDPDPIGSRITAAYAMMQTPAGLDANAIASAAAKGTAVAKVE